LMVNESEYLRLVLTKSAFAYNFIKYGILMVDSDDTDTTFRGPGTASTSS
jgi:hypothetical protein